MIVANRPAGNIGLGCVTFGREIDKAASFAMMDHAVANGIVFFDTAAAYGAGASEAVIGYWLAERKEAAKQVVIATKIVPPYTAGAIMAAVDGSRRRLGTDTIDLLFLHRWDDAVPTVETLITLHQLVQSGAVRALGASNFSSMQLEEAVRLQKKLQLHYFRFAQNNHNYAVREYDAGFRQVCAAQAIDMISYSPLGAGFLTGKHRQGVQPGSRFDLVPAHQPVYFTVEAQNRLQQLLEVAQNTGYTPAHLALAWAFRQPVAMVLAGGRSAAHLDQALAAMAFDDEQVLAALKDE